MKKLFAAIVVAFLPMCAYSQINQGGGAGSVQNPGASSAGGASLTTTSPQAFAGPITAPNLVVTVLPIAGTDSGTVINNAIAALGSTKSTILLSPTSTWNFAVPIVRPYNIILDCQGAVLNWTGSTTGGAAIVLASAASPPLISMATNGLRNCHLQQTYNAANTNYGIYLGGDPAGVISPSTMFGSGIDIEGTTVTGFQCGLTHGNNVWALKLRDSGIFNNTEGICSFAGTTNSGEKQTLVNTVVANNFDLGFSMANINDAWTATNSWCDYNTNGCAGGTGVNLAWTGGHIENFNGPLINMTGGGGFFSLNNTTMAVTATTGSEQGFISAAGPSANVSVINPQIFDAHNVPYVFYTTAGSSVNYCQLGQVNTSVVGNPPAPFGGTASTALCPFGSASFYSNGGVPILASSNNHVIANFFTPAPPAGWNVGIQVGNISSTTLTNSNAVIDFVEGSTATNGTGNLGFVNNLGMLSWDTLGNVGIGNANPTAAPWYVDALGDVTGTNYSIPVSGKPTFKAVTAPSFLPSSVTVGPGLSYFNDFIDTNWTAVSIGAATGGNGCTLSPGNGLGQNNVGVMAIASGTGGAGTGEGCYPGGNVLDFFTPNSSLGWTEEASVFVPVLPATTAATYEVGISAGTATVPWTTGYGFYLSSANAVQNDWYCMYGSTYTDSTVAATVAHTRLSMVSDGTNFHWYINGTQVCGTGTALSGMPSNTTHIGEAAAVAGTATSVVFQLDYYLMQRAIVR
jgi:hypothetical protein